MKRGGPLKRRKGVNRVSPRRIAYEEELDAITPALMARANDLCEICREQPIGARHHRLRRSQGGTNDLSNLLALCEWDHKRVHDNPSWAYDHGYLLRRGDVA